ncbi:MAG: hypothetical protein JRG95_15660 [Deltaproteobacteria bacterium]|nr:hypothetical protein [Deltaproteobacteria bacterium]
MKLRSLQTPVALGALLVLTLGVGECFSRYSFADQPMLFLDWMDDGEVTEIAPGSPMIRPGPDLLLGTADDVIFIFRPGDVDLVIRSDRTVMGATFPASHVPGTEPQVAVAAFATGIPIDFVVAPSTHPNPGTPISDLGTPTVSPNLIGVPIIIAAFADIDGDGFIGITELDGDPGDFGIEDSELTPVAQTVVISDGGEVAGQLFPAAGGPTAAPLRLSLVAAAWAGTLDPAFQNGVVPDGPLVMTHLPFHPKTDPSVILQGGAAGLAPPTANGPVGAEIKPALQPDPNHPKIGEAFTMPQDGTNLSTDLATALSGPALRAGLARRPDPATFDGLPSRPLRPGLDAGGQRMVLEVLQRLAVADDGAASSVVLQVIPLDLLGNVADLVIPLDVEVRVEGPIAIISPDTDGDPFRETLQVTDARGLEIIVDDLGGAFDGANTAVVHIEDQAGAVSRTPVFLPDPDVNDSGLVDASDVALVDAAKGLRHGDPGFDPNLDLTGDGRIGADDSAVVQAASGQTIAIP